MSATFLWGAQYYRAPTPDRSCWDADLGRMAALGFTSAKLWVQWRWSHRARDEFHFDDLEALIGLARRHDLAVHLNVIFDVTPSWLIEAHPDCHLLLADGRPILPFESAHRQIGGLPGPSYCHPEARAAREAFLRAAVTRLRGHPNLAAWDLWNEPELGFPYRAPDPERLADYNPHTIAAFRRWLAERYGSIENLNQVWGRCYRSFDEVEAPRSGRCIQDFIDWRDFHCQLLAEEARWRLAVVAELDPQRQRFIHVVPSTASMWNAVGTATDDRLLMADSQLYGCSWGQAPWWIPQLATAAGDRPLLNTESHVNHGCQTMHQRRLDLAALRANLLPQIGGGVRGFQFWQFRSEVLGWEAPAWGLVDPDGSDRPATAAVDAFWQILRPHTDALLGLRRAPGEIAVWRSRRGEAHHASIHGDLKRLRDGTDAWLQALHWQGLDYRIFASDELHDPTALDGIKLLILPDPYCLHPAEAATIDAFLRAGGVVCSEAHLGAWQDGLGRHAAVVPGHGLARRWGLREIDATSSYHLDLEGDGAIEVAVTEDVRKALEAQETRGRRGARCFPFGDGGDLVLWGAERYAPLRAEGGACWARLFDGEDLVVASRLGAGTLVYAGTLLGLGAALSTDHRGLRALVRRLCALAAIDVPDGDDRRRVRIDRLRTADGTLRALVVTNEGDAPFELDRDGLTGRAVFAGRDLVDAPLRLAPAAAELIMLEPVADGHAAERPGGGRQALLAGRAAP